MSRARATPLRSGSILPTGPPWPPRICKASRISQRRPPASGSRRPGCVGWGCAARGWGLTRTSAAMMAADHPFARVRFMVTHRGGSGAGTGCCGGVGAGCGSGEGSAGGPGSGESGSSRRGPGSVFSLWSMMIPSGLESFWSMMTPRCLRHRTPSKRLPGGHTPLRPRASGSSGRTAPRASCPPAGPAPSRASTCDGPPPFSGRPGRVLDAVRHPVLPRMSSPPSSHRIAGLMIRRCASKRRARRYGGLWAGRSLHEAGGGGTPE